MQTYYRGYNLISDDTNRYYMHNAHGDVVEVFTGKNEGNIYYYNAFGTTSHYENTEIPNKWGYCDQLKDFETGNYYMRARYYNPDTGRFISEDTYWNPSNMIYGDRTFKEDETKYPDITASLQAGNLYGYCTNNPIRYFDYTGHREESYWSLKNDPMGLKILLHYLYGNGESLYLNGNDLLDHNSYCTVGQYMMNNKGDVEHGVKPLGEQIKEIVFPYGNALKNNQSLSINITTSIVIENGEDIIGYQYLHGTNADVGGFNISGTISKNDKGDITYNLTYTWNDIIDPNFEYSSDKAKAQFAQKIANPQNYTIQIKWTDTTIIRAKETFFNRSSGWLSN